MTDPPRRSTQDDVGGRLLRAGRKEVAPRGAKKRVMARVGAIAIAGTTTTKLAAATGLFHATWIRWSAIGLAGVSATAAGNHVYSTYVKQAEIAHSGPAAYPVAYPVGSGTGHDPASPPVEATRDDEGTPPVTAPSASSVTSLPANPGGATAAGGVGAPSATAAGGVGAPSGTAARPTLDRVSTPAAPVVTTAPSASGASGASTQDAQEPPLAARTLRDEVTQLDAARRALNGADPRGALAALDAYDASHPAGALRDESTVLRVRALERAGDHEEALALYQRFAASHPNSPHLAALRAAFAP